MGEGWREVLKACEDIVKKVKSLLRGWGEEGCGGGVRRGEVGCGCEGIEVSEKGREGVGVHEWFYWS